MTVMEHDYRGHRIEIVQIEHMSFTTVVDGQIINERIESIRDALYAAMLMVERLQ